MTQTQKLIKYFAIALAIYLIVMIFSGIFYVGSTVLESIGIIDGNSNISENLTTISEEVNDVDELFIALKGSKLEVIEGDTFKVETNNSNIKYYYVQNQLNVSEKGRAHYVANSKKNSKVIVTIPKEYNFKKRVYLEAGAGDIKIDTINTSIAELDLGAGKVIIKELNATDHAKIEGGAGTIDIKKGTINNLNLSLGVGKSSVKGILTGSSKVEGGVGDFNLNLTNSLDNYTISIYKGIGDAIVNGKKYSDSSKVGTGNNTISIKGGIGKIKVKTKQEE